MWGWRQRSPYGELTVAVSERGVREISLPGDDQPAVEFGDPDRAVEAQLDEWFAGERHDFDVPLDLDGIEGFRRAVLETLSAKVSWGETVSYGELAGMAGRPRWSSGFWSASLPNTLPFVIPVPRVIVAGHCTYGSRRGCNS